MKKKKNYYYTTNWAEYPPHDSYEIKVYYDKPKETKYLKKLLTKLHPNDTVLLDSISDIAPSWDVLIKTLQILHKKSIDLCLNTGYGYVIDICPHCLLLWLSQAIASGQSLNCLKLNFENIINLGGEYYG